jgi:hypothetical protein
MRSAPSAIVALIFPLPPYTAAPIPDHNKNHNRRIARHMTTGDLAGTDLLAILEQVVERSRVKRRNSWGGAMRRHRTSGAVVELPELRLRTLVAIYAVVFAERHVVRVSIIPTLVGSRKAVEHAKNQTNPRPANLSSIIHLEQLQQ